MIVHPVGATVMVESVIFDMDGLLIDSEPFWREAEIEVFREVGVHVTDAMCEEIMGLRIDEVVLHWYGRFPWNHVALKTVADRIVDGVVRRVEERGSPMPGVMAILDFFARRKVPMAIATSSVQRLADAVVRKLQFGDCFRFIQSAETLPLGKPHPDIFLKTARVLGVDPVQCLVFEDSMNGVIAAKAARMKSVCVPAPHQFSDPRFAIADLKLESLTQFTEDHWKFFCA